ncbi:MAG: response regulator [Planctomycetes bacterium]|nr:response regulator [Planctomycetota bacterium]
MAEKEARGEDGDNIGSLKLQREIRDANILILDDSPELCRSLRATLQHLGFNAGFLVNPQRVMEKLDSDAYDLLLMDYNMPQVDGLKLVMDLRNHQKYANLPIIMMTGYATESMILKSFTLGANDFIEKPIHPNVLEARIKATLAYSQVLSKSYERIRNMNHQLEELILQVESASRAKSDFMGSMSHELRTPLHGILGSTDFLLESEEDEEKISFLGLTKKSGLNLLGIIDQILDFSRYDNDTSQVHDVPFNLHDEMDRLMIVAGEARHKGVDFQCLKPEKNRVVVGDIYRIKQIVSNFLSNAFKFTKKGKVTLQICEMSLSQKEVVYRFMVTDTGMGFNIEDREHLFEPFTQADQSMSRSHGGVGMGLAICRKHAALIQAQVRCSSKEGEGSRFWIDTPLVLEGNEV